MEMKIYKLLSVMLGSAMSLHVRMQVTLFPIMRVV